MFVWTSWHLGDGTVVRTFQQLAERFGSVLVYFVLLLNVFCCCCVDCSRGGRKVKNKTQLARVLGCIFDLAGFDFRTRRMTSGVHRSQCIL